MSESKIINNNKHADVFSNEEEVEIEITCVSEDGHSICFGNTIDVNDSDVVWVYEGISECIAENWHEFEDLEADVEKQCMDYYEKNGIIPLSDADIDIIAKDFLAKHMGKIEVIVECIEGPNLTLNLDHHDIGKEIYNCICESFSIGYNVFRRLHITDEV